MIALVTSYNVPCGVAEHARGIVRALKVHKKNYIILSNSSVKKIKTEEDEFPCFISTIWDQQHYFNDKMAFEKIMQLGTTRIILEYQNCIYEKKNLYLFLSQAKKYGIEIFIILHDSCVEPDFPWNLIDKVFVPSDMFKQCFPNSELLKQGTYLIMDKGMTYYREKLKIPQGDFIISTFGLGRTNYFNIREVCDITNSKMMILDPTSSSKTRADVIINKWLELEELLFYLMASNMIILEYPPIQTFVTSSAARIALSAKRRLIVNAVGWFHDLHYPVVVRYKDSNELMDIVKLIQINDTIPQEHLDYIKRNEWSQVCLPLIN